MVSGTKSIPAKSRTEADSATPVGLKSRLYICQVLSTIGMRWTWNETSKLRSNPQIPFATTLPMSSTNLSITGQLCLRASQEVSRRPARIDMWPEGTMSYDSRSWPATCGTSRNIIHPFQYTFSTRISLSSSSRDVFQKLTR